MSRNRNGLGRSGAVVDPHARLNFLLRKLRESTAAYYRAIEHDREPSSRIYGWIDEYNNIKKAMPMSWASWCAEYGFSPEHEAFDLFA